MSSESRGRISAAMATVKCPGCGKWVVPTASSPKSAEPSTGPEEGKRWSFIWRPPSGVLCPECFFPLERHARRMKWVHTATLGLIMEVLALLLFAVYLMGRQGQWMQETARVVAGAGALLLVAGVLGVILGGRSRSPGDES